MTTYVWKGKPDDESRQQYATTRINDYRRIRQALGFPLSFNDLLGAFKHFGKLYDEGARLRDLAEEAA